MLADPVNRMCHVLALFGEHALMPAMIGSFVVAVVLRALIFYTVRSEFGFAKEFETRVHRHLDREYDDIPAGTDFHALTESLLRRTFHEVFKLRETFLRRKLDRALTFADRLFLIEEGAKRVIHDTVRQTKYYKNHEGDTPAFDDVAKFVFLSNPYFNRVVGLFPIALSNDVLNILPSLFIIGGVFNTLLGIMLGLPELRAMDVANFAAAKGALDGFLAQMALGMNTSILGLAFAVALTVINTVLSPSGMVVTMTDKFKLSLEFLWNDTGSGGSVRAAPPTHVARGTIVGRVPPIPRRFETSAEPRGFTESPLAVAGMEPSEPSIELSLAARLLKDRLASGKKPGGRAGDSEAA